jgi:hypothetical protein
MADRPAQPYIDLATLNIVLPYDRPVTGEEWNALQWPPCPRCGETVLVDRADVTPFPDKIRSYICGRWECPNECGPRKV